MYVDIVPNRNSKPAILLREAWREKGKIKKRTIANLSDWPREQVEALRQVLRGDYRAVGSAPELVIERSLPHGAAAAVLGTIRKLELEEALTLPPDPNLVPNRLQQAQSPEQLHENQQTRPARLARRTTI